MISFQQWCWWSSSWPVVVIAEIRSSSGTAVTNVVHSLSSLKIPFHDDDDDDDDYQDVNDEDDDEQWWPVELPGLERAPCSSVSSGQSLGGEVVVLPRAKHIPDHSVIMIMIIRIKIVMIVTMIKIMRMWWFQVPKSSLMIMVMMTMTVITCCKGRGHHCRACCHHNNRTERRSWK